MITEEMYLLAKKIIESYESKQVNNWLCKKDLRMENGEICFVNNKEYKQIEATPLTLRDEQGFKHVVGDKWEKWFKGQNYD